MEASNKVQFPTKQEMGDTERICTQEPHRILLGFSPPFDLILLSLEENR